MNRSPFLAVAAIAVSMIAVAPTMAQTCAQSSATCALDCIQLPGPTIGACPAAGGTFGDACAGASTATVTAGSGVVFCRNNLAGATADMAPVCNGVAVTSNGVWYDIAGNGNTMTAATCSSGTMPTNGCGAAAGPLDTQVSVYSGGCAGLTCVNANDNFGAGSGCGAGASAAHSSVDWCAVSGTTYSIFVQGTSGGPALFDLRVEDSGTACTADLSITKTGPATMTVGQMATYTITATNAGGITAAATVTDTFPAALTGVTWTCVAAGGATCTAMGMGNIADAVSLPVMGTVTYTATGSFTGTLTNTATVSSMTPDPNAGNNSASVTTTAIAASADLSITKAGPAGAMVGQMVTYTITATNLAGNTTAAATVTDTFPAALTGVNWTCVAAGGAACTAMGAGNIADAVTLPVMGTVTYTATGTFTGALTNTATVSSMTPDPNAGNNSFSVMTGVVAASADLSLTKSNGLTTAAPGQGVTYTIVASNAGPNAAGVATVTDTFPAALSNVQWTCVAAGGAACTAGPAMGAINDTVNLPVMGSVTYTVSTTISASFSGPLSNTAAVSSAVADPNPANNSATDTTTVSGAGPPVPPVPALPPAALLILAALLATAARAAQRRTMQGD